MLMLGSGFARTAAAFEWDLPGERRLSIHGFYESRLLFVGSELPVNGATWSSFRHVLSTELELTLLPDGFGPLDSLFLFSHFLVSYDCIYTRACGLANGADSYGDDRRSAVRQPLSLAENVKNNPPYFAGLLEQKYRPGSVTPAQEILNPARRYRDCENPPGVFANPFPLAVFCNLNNRSPLDNPNNQTGDKYWEVRAGSFHPFTRPSLTAAARSALGDDEFARLQSLLIRGKVLSPSEAAYRIALLAEGKEAEAAAILGTAEDSFDANIPELLDTRPDPDRFSRLANDMAPELLTAKWGSSRLRNLVWPFLATINTPIRPQGYFLGGGAVDSIGQNDQALGETIKATIGGLPFATDKDGLSVYTDDNAKARANPFFVGPDGVRDTADDLPYVENNARARAAGYELLTPIAGTTVDRFDTGVYEKTAQIEVTSAIPSDEAKRVELYGVYTHAFLLNQSCKPPSIYDPTTQSCTRDGQDITAQALERGCKMQANGNSTLNIGTNGDGDCIEINMSSAPAGSQLQFEVISLLGDIDARPLEATREPLDATDFRSVATDGVNNTLPARPRAPDNGIVLQSPGARAQYEQYHRLVSNLDLEYSVDQLAWNHGASQREHEFAEGYLEFGMANSQVYARLGKLIEVWGKTELFRNQDRSNPLDTGSGIFVPLEEQRVGQWAIDLTFSPDLFVRVGPVEDLRLEILSIVNPFEPTDNGKCGEGTAVDLICLKSFGAMSNGLSGLGEIGEHRPNDDYSGIEAWDFGARLEGRLERFTFALSDFWGWDDGFYLEPVQQYERTSDPNTGAPLSVNTIRSTGCTVRTIEVEGEQIAVGPDGRADTIGDNAFPSAGECLLWDPPDTPDAPQHLRSADSVAALQNVNQTLFHSLCAYTFDPDEGFCAFDRLNYPLEFGAISNILSGLGNFGSTLLDGLETVQRASPDGSTSVTQRGSTNFLSQQFLAIEPLAQPAQNLQDLGVSLQSGQAALLGCGPAYASACSKEQWSKWSADRAIATDLARDADLGMSKVGGIDLMNADASVVTQEFVGLKALSPGALVGTKLAAAQQLYYQNGIDYSRNGQQNMNVDTDFTRQGVQRVVPPQVGTIETGEYLPLTPTDVINLGTTGRAEFQIQPGHMVEADGWIEPMPWTVNQEMLEKFGAIVFNTDPKNVLDLDSPLNKWNLIDPNQDPNDVANIQYSDIDGEYCSRWMSDREDQRVATPFNIGCTGLETVSANFERLLISLEIIGNDRVFSPPESLQELGYWSESNTMRQAAGDPISGPDGIFARNQYVLSNTEEDFEVVSAPHSDDSQFVTVPVGEEDPHVAAERFLLDYEPNDSCEQDWCYLNVQDVLVDHPGDALPVPGTPAKTLIIAMPIGMWVAVVDVTDPNHPNATPPVENGTSLKVNLARLQYFDLPTLRRLLAGQAIAVQIGDATQFVQMNQSQRDALLGVVGALGNEPDTRGRDMDLDQSADLDRNRDGIWDGQDDYLPGPITDDNILCGSGIPGDRLQDGVQYSPYRADEMPGSPKFDALFPNGLPPRSPVFCRNVSGLLGATTQTLPVRRAGGDGRYGRRDFLWQNGRQVVLNYQKRNVLGFAVDFAEETTKSSWGIEFSWVANKLFPNTREYDALSQSDEMVLSISVDRPTYLNFLNPNRSFFIDLQMFLRYLPDYQGGRGHGDGMYGAAGASLTGNVVLSFFTGYFQDRLSPRVTILYAPWESQGAVITGITYRWTDAFSTSIGFTQFFGHVYDRQSSYFPIAQYGSVADYTTPVQRGLAPVLYRDQAELRVRYAW